MDSRKWRSGKFFLLVFFLVENGREGESDDVIEVGGIFSRRASKIW